MCASLLASARDAYKLGDFDQAIEICESGITHARELNNSEPLCRFLILQSQSYWARGNFPKALSLTEFPEEPRSFDIESSARLLNQRGFLLTQVGDFAQSKKTFAEAERLAQIAARDELTAEILLGVGTLHFYLGDYETLELVARSALVVAERKEIPSMMASACAAVGKSYMYRNRELEAIRWFERSLQLFERMGSDYYASTIRSELGCCYFALYEDEKAMAFFAEALHKSSASLGRTSQHIDLANIGAIHLRRGDYDDALKCFERALEIARELGDRISIAKWLHNIALTYSRLGNILLARTYDLEAELVKRDIAKSCDAAR